jgi:glycosyltransferase involved in cell wall biosynthesis
MRILHVIGSLSPADGGPPEGVRQLAKAWARLGDTVEVACLDSPNEPFIADLSCPVHALGNGYGGRFSFSPRLAHWLRSNSSRFDTLVMEGIWTYPGIAVRSEALRSGKPYGVFPHGALDPWFNRKYPLKRIKKTLYWPIQYPVLRDAKAVFFTGKTERDLAETGFRPSQWKSVVIPYGIGDPEGDPTTQVHAFLSRFPALKDRRFLLFLGRLHEKKGCDLLLHAFARIARSVPNLDLVIAGPDQDGLQAKLLKIGEQFCIDSRIHWTGILSGNLKWGALRSADAFVLPSHQENFGIAVVESLAVGRPVLISDKVNIWPLIDRDGVGLVESDTIDGTEQLLHRWLALQPEQRLSMANRATGCFRKHFSISATAHAIREALLPAGTASSTLS